jgi:hypothetical protein
MMEMQNRQARKKEVGKEEDHIRSQGPQRTVAIYKKIKKNKKKKKQRKISMF